MQGELFLRGYLVATDRSPEEYIDIIIHRKRLHVDTSLSHQWQVKYTTQPNILYFFCENPKFWEQVLCSKVFVKCI